MQIKAGAASAAGHLMKQVRGIPIRLLRRGWLAATDVANIGTDWNPAQCRFDNEDQMRQRVIVCPVIENEGAYLLCRMPRDRGVFPGQWALSGGGVEPGERIEDALLREVSEELGSGLEIHSIKPWTFRDDVR